MSAFTDKNRRRIALIRKDIAEGLNNTEQQELEALTEYVDAYVDKVAPLPPFPPDGKLTI